MTTSRSHATIIDKENELEARAILSVQESNKAVSLRLSGDDG